MAKALEAVVAVIKGFSESSTDHILSKLPAQSKADLEPKRSCGRLELLHLWKCSHLYYFAPFLFEAR